MNTMGLFSLKKISISCLPALLFAVFFLSNNGECGSIVQTLPGFNGNLPFVLETGYTSVGDIEFFYYFVESESEPESDPVLVYMNGGPGCSSLNGFFYQVGPLRFNTTRYTGGVPELLYYSQAWTQVANIIFLDAPVGAGFSYATTAAGYPTNDSYSVETVHGFLRKWLEEHPRFVWNPFYIGTDSYVGLYAPILSQEIINGNEAGMDPRINLKGYSIGCAHTDTNIEDNTRFMMAHRFGIISDELYEAAKNVCHGWYVDIDAANTECIEMVAEMKTMYADVSPQHILEPRCAFLSPEQEDEESTRRSLSETSTSSLLRHFSSTSKDGELECHDSHYLFTSIWANFESVREALHVRPGTIKYMQRCNITLSYTKDITNAVPYHINLTSSGLQTLVFSGDHDLVIPHISMEEWISAMNLTVDTDWRPWFADGQVAGYTVKYTNEGYRLTYATIKGAGHSPQEYERRACYLMFSRWIQYYPL